jgi:hypothetical protein
MCRDLIGWLKFYLMSTTERLFVSIDAAGLIGAIASSAGMRAGRQSP